MNDRDRDRDRDDRRRRRFELKNVKSYLTEKGKLRLYHILVFSIILAKRNLSPLFLHRHNVQIKSSYLHCL